MNNVGQTGQSGQIVNNVPNVQGVSPQQPLQPNVNTPQSQGTQNQYPQNSQQVPSNYMQQNVPQQPVTTQTTQQQQQLDHSLDGQGLSLEPEIDMESVKEEAKQYDDDKSFGVNYIKKILQPGDNVIRLVGNYEKVHLHWISGDDNFKRPYLCTGAEGGCLICDFIAAFSPYELIEVTDQQGNKKKRRKYFYMDINPILAKKVLGDYTNNIPGWYTKERVLYNCIDRDDAWCTQNKHTKILTTSKSAIGIGQTIHASILSTMQEYGAYYRYDIKITKKVGRTYRETSYIILPKHDGMFELTPEEKTYNIYDLNKIKSSFRLENDFKNDLKQTLRQLLLFLAQQGTLEGFPKLYKLAYEFNIFNNNATTVPMQSQTVPPVSVQQAPQVQNNNVSGAAEQDNNVVQTQMPLNNDIPVQGNQPAQQANDKSQSTTQAPQMPVSGTSGSSQSQQGLLCPICGGEVDMETKQCKVCAHIL